jgi:hypothetical protein
MNHRSGANPALAVLRALSAERICRPAATTHSDQLSVHSRKGDRSIVPRREHGVFSSNRPGEEFTLALVGQRSEIVLEDMTAQLQAGIVQLRRSATGSSSKGVTTQGTTTTGLARRFDNCQL